MFQKVRKKWQKINQNCRQNGRAVRFCDDCFGEEGLRAGVLRPGFKGNRAESEGTLVEIPFLVTSK